MELGWNYKMNYQMLWLDKNKNAYSNYAKNKKELKSKLDYFMNKKGLKLNDYDRFNNIQVSKKIKGSWLILNTNENLDMIK